MHHHLLFAAAGTAATRTRCDAANAVAWKLRKGLRPGDYGVELAADRF